MRNEQKERNEKTRGPKAVIGTRTGDNELRVIGERFIPVFISRLAPSTSVDEVIAYVKDVQNIEVKCAQLKTRHASYSSFKLEVICNSLSNFLEADNWPAGAYVRKFFSGKNNLHGNNLL